MSTLEDVEAYYDLNNIVGNRSAFLGVTRQLFAQADSIFLKRITAPTLILWGNEDRLLPVERAPEFLAGIPHAQLKTYSRLGHMLPQAHKKDTAADVRIFLEFPQALTHRE